MDTTFVLGLMVVFFAIPGIVIGAGLLVMRELKPGYLTRHKEKVLAIVCIILAVYGASIVCTESEGGDYPGALNKYDRECSHEVIMAQQTSSQDMDVNILASYRESPCRYCRMVAMMWYSIETQDERDKIRNEEDWKQREERAKSLKGGWFSGGPGDMSGYWLQSIANSLSALQYGR